MRSAAGRFRSRISQISRRHRYFGGHRARAINESMPDIIHNAAQLRPVALSGRPLRRVKFPEGCAE
jgi:hypothetical protein